MTKTREHITSAVEHILKDIPPDTILVAAAKGRSVEELQIALEAGVRYFGENYIQEAETVIPPLREKASWHFIGHLQRNKVNKAALLFDMIESLDSIRLAEALSKACEREGILMPVLIEVNSGEEENKDGIPPDNAVQLAELIDQLPHLKLKGLMTMGPASGDPEEARPYFQLTRHLFEKIAALNLPNSDMQYLSMGMSNSYHIALEEGANIIRIGTRIFGPRV
ncbi:MAG: YggS family pyridoxal phosphate-dependent enzyme [Anaerolineales bacterium]|nr:YggS family pyridoxal phosphate-dependent enzyme [Anaerolineales bacterium]